jgi:uncharacterized surface protein with fasciclin (FAS1) repeats
MSNRLRSLLAVGLAAAAAAGCVAPANESAPPSAAPAAIAMVGGAAMSPSRTIVQNASASKDHTTLIQVVKAAGLAGQLDDTGPFTLFAPTNAAFDKLPPGTVQTLLDPANKSLLANILSYHIVPGRKTRSDIAADIRAGGGSAAYRTLAGGTVRARMEGTALLLFDVKGGRSRVTQADVTQSNGVFHVVDTVLLPAI